MRYEGAVFRPPSEAGSLIVQVTVGCANNQCTFCGMYKNKKFRVRDKKVIIEDFKLAKIFYGDGIRRIFLADGDALCVKTEILLDILNEVKILFPYAERVTSYATAKDIINKSDKELKDLKDAGLDMLYIGLESGDDEILKAVKKNITAEEMILGVKKAKACGIKCSVTIISGLGGKERLKEHSLKSAEVITQMKPEYVGFLTLMVNKGTEMERDIKDGKITLLSPYDVADELILFLNNVDSEGTVFRSNHASNYLVLRGTLNKDIPKMLDQIEFAKSAGYFRKETYRGL